MDSAGRGDDLAEGCSSFRAPPPQFVKDAAPALLDLESRTESFPSTVVQQRLAPSNMQAADSMDSLRPGSAPRAHPLLRKPDLLESVRLLKVSALRELPLPWPRCQDVPDAHVADPGPDDVVVALSHAWRNQVHPDPDGAKHRHVQGIVKALSKLHSSDDILLFVDFLSIPQRSWRAGQTERTREEDRNFHSAIRDMHYMYFLADYVMHLEIEPNDMAGEGGVYKVTLQDLLGKEVYQVGNQVCVGLHESDGAAVGSFHQVLAVGMHPIHSLQAYEARAESSPPSTTVSMQRLPFGPRNELRASKRGWIFLERFITMVKCAMVDSKAAKTIVLSNSRKVKKEILAGADKLRHAANASDKKDALRVALETFEAELLLKQFSPITVDKAGATAAAKSRDAEIVVAIMRQFVDFLDEHWHAAAKQQQRRASVRAALGALEHYILCWKGFSSEYHARMRVEGSGSRWPLAAHLVLPVLVASGFLAYPFAELDHGWRGQAEYFVVKFLSFTACASIFTELVLATTNQHGIRRAEIFACFWILGAGVAATGTEFLLALFFDVFPVPMASTMTASMATPLFPLLYFTASPQKRAQSEFRWKLIYSMLGVMAMMAAGVITLPLSNTVLHSIDSVCQAFWTFAYLAIKLIFEKIGDVLSNRLGSDKMPLFVWTAAVAYELNLCIALAGGFSWLSFGLLIGIDVVENIYHLVCCLRNDDEGVRFFIMSQLLLREFVEAIAPLQFLAVMTIARLVQPQNSTFLCSLSDRDFLFIQQFLLLDFAIELVVGQAIQTVLRAKGYAPLQLTVGLTRIHTRYFISSHCAVALFYLTMPHTHVGMDMTFQFAWLRGSGETSSCGYSR